MQSQCNKEVDALIFVQNFGPKSLVHYFVELLDSHTHTIRSEWNQ